MRCSGMVFVYCRVPVGADDQKSPRAVMVLQRDPYVKDGTDRTAVAWRHQSSEGRVITAYD